VDADGSHDSVKYRPSPACEDGINLHNKCWVMFGLKHAKNIFQVVGLLLLRADNWLTDSASKQMPPLNLHNVIVSWIYVPLGIFITLFACFGADALIRLSSFSFPASVACMILLFFILLLSQLVLGDRLTRKILGVLDVPVSETSYSDFLSNCKQLGFTLRWISICFCPAFVLLPISPVVGGREVGKIIAVLRMFVSVS
jgi:hypothetical protein